MTRSLRWLRGVLGLGVTWGVSWGAIFAPPVHESTLIILCPIGAALAAGSLALAKKAALRAAPEQPKLT